MADITPVTREEFYLAKAGGQDVPVPSAVTREEYYLEKLSNDSVVVPSPVTRREKFLYFACGGEIDLPSEEKMTRLERLIAKAGGMDVSTPTAVIRLEKFWANVENGGWTITGVLPLTFTAKGGTAVDWVIYGNNNQQGVGERTENLYDKNTYMEIRAWIKSDGEIQEGSLDWQVSDYIPIEANENYTISNVVGFSPAYCLYDSNKNYISGNTYANNTKIIFQAPANAAFARFSVKYGSISGADPNIDVFMVTKGSIAPDYYIPYGYQVPITISQAGQPDKTVDIYIGDSPLTEGENVSKTSTGVDIELFEGENTVSTTLYNKPAMKIKYK